MTRLEQERIDKLRAELEWLRERVSRAPEGVRWGGWSAEIALDEARIAEIKREIEALESEEDAA